MYIAHQNEWKAENKVLMLGGVGVGPGGAVACSAQVVCISCLVGLGEGLKEESFSLNAVSVRKQRLKASLEMCEELTFGL